jgi:transposase
VGIVFGIMDERKPKLTAEAKEARRRLAIRNVLSGRSQADVADFLGVHPVTVAKWMAAYWSSPRIVDSV